MARFFNKSGGIRRGKPTITVGRLHLRNCAWVPLRQALRIHVALSKKGEQKRMARMCGINASQIHRFLCEDCEHDQEPNFSVGFALFIYLLYQRQSPVIDIPKPKRKKKQK